MLQQIGVRPVPRSSPAFLGQQLQKTSCGHSRLVHTCSRPEAALRSLPGHLSEARLAGGATRAATLDSPSVDSLSRSFQAELDQPYPVTQEAVDFYATNGYIRLHNVFTAPLLEEYSHIISQAVQAADQTPLESDDDYAKAFTQIMNIWETNEDVKNLVFSNRLGSIAAQLLQVWHCMLWKALVNVHVAAG